MKNEYLEQLGTGDPTCVCGNNEGTAEVKGEECLLSWLMGERHQSAGIQDRVYTAQMNGDVDVCLTPVYKTTLMCVSSISVFNYSRVIVVDS